MTLYTRMAVTTPGIDPEATLDHLVTLIGATPDQLALAQKNGPDPASALEFERNRSHSIDMPPGLGLPALSDVSYSPTGNPLPLSEYETNSLDEASKDEDKTFAPRSHLMIGFDTAYSYKAPNGAGCGDLHAWIVREMGAWLTKQGASWDWYDESGWGWSAEWKGDESRLARNSRVSAEWGTLGDPDVGALDSMIPSVTRDSRQAFLEDQVLPALDPEME